MPPSGGPAQPTTNPETSGTLESRTMPSIVHPGATPDAGNNTFSSDGFSTAATDGSATVGTLPSGTGVHATPPASRTAAAVPGAMQHARSGDSLAVQHGSEAGGSPPASAPSPLSAGMRPTPASTGGITGTRAFPSSMGGTTGKAGALPAYLLVSGAPVGAGGGADLDAPSIPSVSSEAMAPPPTEAVPPPTGAFAAKAAQVDVPRADTIGDTVSLLVPLPYHVLSPGLSVRESRADGYCVKHMTASDIVVFDWDRARVHSQVSLGPRSMDETMCYSRQWIRDY